MFETSNTLNKIWLQQGLNSHIFKVEKLNWA